MWDPQNKYSLLLSHPAYRNWISPDASQLSVRVRGGDDAGLSDIQMRVVVTEFDTDRVEHRVFILPRFARELAIPAPRLHSGGEVLILLEDSRSGDALAEGRWNVRSLDERIARTLAYFDGRGLLIRQGKAVFPLVAKLDAPWTSRAQVEERIQDFADAGFNAIVWTRHCTFPLEDCVAAAADRNLGVFVQIDAGPELALQPLATDLVRWRSLDGLWGFLIQAEPDDNPLELYRMLRSKCNSKFCVLMLSQKEAVPDGFEDAVAVPCRDLQSERPEQQRLQGRIAFAVFDGSTSTEENDCRSNFFKSLIQGASGAIWNLAAQEASHRSLRQVLKEAQTAATMLTHGHPVEWTAADLNEFSSQKLEIWTRRFRDEVLLAVRFTGEEAQDCRIPVTLARGRLFVIGEQRQVVVEGGTIREAFRPDQVRVYSNHPFDPVME